MSGSFSFVHAADLHLDSTFRGFAQIAEGDELVRQNVLTQLRNCTFIALDNIVEACLQNKVDFLLLAGDIFDLADRSLRAQFFFREAMVKLAQRGIRVFVVWGNHDHDEGLRAQLSWPENVHFFASGEVEYSAVERQGREIARVYGISYPRRDVAENYARRFLCHPESPFSIGVLHCNVGGVAGHENYAPCQLDDLLKSRFDYWALGHVHARRVLKDNHPCIVYPGNPQGRHPREGAEKGCYLVKVAGNGLINLQFLPVDTVRWREINVSITGMVNEDDLLRGLENRLQEVQARHPGRSVVVRIRLSGRSPLHKRLQNEATINDLLGELRARFAPARGNFLWPESICGQTGIPVAQETIRRSQTLLGDLLLLSREALTNDDLRARLQQALSPLAEGAGYRLPLPAGEEFADLLAAAEELAVDLLWEEEQQ